MGVLKWLKRQGKQAAKGSDPLIAALLPPGAQTLARIAYDMTHEESLKDVVRIRNLVRAAGYQTLTADEVTAVLAAAAKVAAITEGVDDGA